MAMQFCSVLINVHASQVQDYMPPEWIIESDEARNSTAKLDLYEIY